MNFFGERQHPEKFIPLVINKVLAEKEVSIHANPAKTAAGSRFYLHCRNFASALEFLIGRIERGEVIPPKTHVVGDREVSNLEMAQQIARYVGKPLYYELVDFHSSRPGHDLRYAMADDFLGSAGWKPPVSFDRALERTVRWSLANPRWLAW
jgi:dTDP-D-glucose 4,6-dehydratase